MPLPVPQKKDGKLPSREKWIETCMSNPTIRSDFKDNSQRFAVCMSIYRKAQEKKSKGSDEEISTPIIVVD